MHDIEASRPGRCRMMQAQACCGPKHSRPFHDGSHQPPASQILLQVGPRCGGLRRRKMPPKDTELKCILHFQYVEIGESQGRVDSEKKRFRPRRVGIDDVARNEGAAIRVSTHSGSCRLFLPLDEDEVRKDPIPEDALGTRFNVRPLHTFTSGWQTSRRLLLECANCGEKPPAFSRRKRFDLPQQLGSVHDRNQYPITARQETAALARL